MTTDPIAAARALIEPLTGYTPGQWAEITPDDNLWPPRVFAAGSKFVCMVDNSDDTQEQRISNASLIAAAPDLRDMVATLADALEAERAKVAAAYEVADAWLGRQYGIAPCVNDLTPADAKAALDKLLAEARLEGWRAERDAAAAASAAALSDLQAENQRLRDLALKAYTVVEWVAGDGFILEMPHEDADDLMLEMAKVLGVESSIEARAALRNTETHHDD